MPQTPIEEVLRMQKEGKDDAEIITFLAKRGYSPEQISEALNQAKIKETVSAPESPTEGLEPSIMTREMEREAPAPQRQEYQAPSAEEETAYPYGYGEAPAIDTETIEEIAESIIAEKWEEVQDKINSMTEWKNFTENKMKNIDERMNRIDSSVERMQVALLGKVQEYGQNIKDLGTEMRSMQGAFSKVLPNVVANAKEQQKSDKKKK